MDIDVDIADILDHKGDMDPPLNPTTISLTLRR